MKTVEHSGDDLGSLWYTFRGYTLAESMEWIRTRDHLVNYRIAIIEVTLKFFFFGRTKKVFILLEKEPAKR